MKKIACLLSLMVLSVSLMFGQTNTGTLKIFSEEPVTVFVDQVQQQKYDVITLTAGTHYVKITNKVGLKVYSQIVTITKDQVTSVLVEGDKTDAAPVTSTTPITEKVSNKVLNEVKGMQKTGTLNIFSEFTGVSVWLDEKKQGDDIKTINSIPVGNHYLKIIKDGTSIFGELVTIKDGEATTVLVKNDGQVAEKIMEGKVKEREEYQGKKIDILLTSNAVSQTTGNSMYFPGYYSYWGVSNSVTNTTQVSDFKVVQGGVTEIGDIKLAQLAENQAVLNSYAKINASVSKQTTIGAITFLASLLIGTPLLIDMLGEKHFLHKNSDVHPNWETGVLATVTVTGTIGYYMTMNADKRLPKHYYRVQDAATDAQKYNKKLKKDLGLPESYDVK
jgi:CxxC motif-containing protein